MAFQGPVSADATVDCNIPCKLIIGFRCIVSKWFSFFVSIHFATNKDTRSECRISFHRKRIQRLLTAGSGECFNPNPFHLPTSDAIRPRQCNQVENLSRNLQSKTKILKSSFSTGKCVYCLWRGQINRWPPQDTCITVVTSIRVFLFVFFTGRRDLHSGMEAPGKRESRMQVDRFLCAWMSAGYDWCDIGRRP